MDKRKDFQLETINKTDVYILPMLCESEVQLRNTKRFPQSCYKKTFLGDKTHETYKDGKILILYRLPHQHISNIELWNNFETYLTSLPTYISNYRADKYHQMFVYDVPVLFQEDYDLFLKWKPSQFSTYYKERISLFYGKLPSTNPIMQVLHKDENRYRELEEKIGAPIPRTQEASSIPYWDEEYYQEEYKIKTAFEKYGEFEPEQSK